MSVLLNALAFVVVIGILVGVHEFGHFWVARRCGVRVLRFSFGFGRVIARRTGADGTEYALSALPLGGYVKMLDEREGPVPEAERHLAFNRKPLWQRNAVIAAGPAFNFAFAVLVYWALFLMGDTVLRPILDEVPPQTPAAEAGFRAGDEILAVGGESVTGWSDVIREVLAEGTGNTALAVTVRTDDGATVTRRLNVAATGPVGEQPDLLKTLGWQPARPPRDARLGAIQPGSAAAAAGLEAGDRVIAANGEPVAGWMDLVDAVQAHPGETLALTVERDGERRQLDVAVPQAGVIGVRAAPPDEDTVERFTREISYGPAGALVRGARETWDQGTLMLTMTARMITGEASVKNISGPINIAQFAGDSVAIGPRAFLTLLAVISISLGVINLLPVPVLDGGHLLFNAFEWVLGRPLSEQAQAIGSQIGLALILMLMGLAFYNDLLRVLGGG